MRFGIVGAGFSGAVVARALADAGHDIDVFDSRNHIGGNCHTERDETGVMVHVYGPHIFHTQHEEVWELMNRFGDMRPYRHRVKAYVGQVMYSLPVNLTTINRFFGTDLSSEEAEEFVRAKSDSTIVEPVTFVDQALKFVGPELYEAFFAGYTRKQWGVDPSALPASILARLPVRFNEDDSYFNHPHQAIPADGYTPIIERILDHPNIEVHLSTEMDRNSLATYTHSFWTGPIDAFFGYDEGRLGYRTLDFAKETHEGDYQGHPVVNYCDADVPYTRITEHKFFAPWESHESTVIYKEYSRTCEPGDIPYYPVRLVEEKELLRRYVERAKNTTGVSFLGRLGTYRYIDMDVTIFEALNAGRESLRLIADGKPLPSFFVDPLS